jgi:hypothetical protein
MELYDTNSDWSQARDLAANEPERLESLKRLFLIEAAKYSVLPLDDRRVERFDAGLAGRPQLVRGTSQLLFQGMGRLTEGSLLNVKNRSHAVTAQFSVPGGGASGVLVAEGGRFGGWSLYLLDGRPAYTYNLFGLARFKVAGEEPVGSARAAPSRSSSTGARSPRAASTEPSRWPSPSTRPPTSVRTPAHPSATTTARRRAASPGPSAGCRSMWTLRLRTLTT